MVISFEGRESCIQVYKEVWEDFRQRLSTGEYTYEQLENAKRHNFLKTLDDALSYEENMSTIEVNFSNLRLNYIFCRATKLKDEENSDNIHLSRFLPMSEYIKDDNRFSPKGVEYLYLGCKFGISPSSRKYVDIEKVCLKEIRSEKGDTVGICNFEIPLFLHGKHIRDTNYKVIDLSPWDSYSFEDIEKEFNNLDDKLNDFKSNVNKLVFKLYMKILSSELFKEVENVDNEKKYAPFHCLSYYFKSLGFQGIIYKSTLHDHNDVKNIVLFDKYYAKPISYRIIEVK